MISCTDKTGFSSLDFLSTSTIDNCYLFKKANNDEENLKAKSIELIISNIGAKYVIKGYVACENNKDAEIVKCSLGVSSGGFLFVLKDYVLMVWVEGIPEIRFVKDSELLAPVTAFMPTNYISTKVSKVMGQSPSGIAFLNDLVLESYAADSQPTGMLKCDRALLNAGEPIAYFGCTAGNLPYEPIATGVVGARCALLKGSKTFNRSYKKYSSREGVFLSPTLRGQVSEIYTRLSSGLTLDLSSIKVANAPVSLSYNISASLGLLEKSLEFNESESYFYFGENVSNAVFLINNLDPSLSNGSISSSSALGDIQERYDAIVKEVRAKLTKALAVNSNIIFDQCANLVKELEFSGSHQIKMSVNNFETEVSVAFPKIPMSDVPAFAKVDENASNIETALLSKVEENKDAVDRLRKDDGSYITHDSINEFSKTIILNHVSSKLQEISDNMISGLIESQNLVFERDVYKHDKKCDGTHYVKIPSVGHSEVIESILANSSVFAGLMSKHLMVKNNTIFEVDGLVDKDAFEDGFKIQSVVIDKLTSGSRLSLNLRLNVLQACSPLFTLDRQIKVNKDMLRQALSSCYPDAKVTFTGVETSKLPTTIKKIRCNDCSHTHATINAVNCSNFAQPAYAMNFRVTFDLELNPVSFLDLPKIGDFQKWYETEKTSVNTQALKAGSEWLVKEITKLNLNKGLTFVGRIAGSYSSFKNMRLFVSADIADVIKTTANLVYNICYMKDENGAFVLNEENRNTLLSTLNQLVIDAEFGGIYLVFDSTTQSYILSKVNKMEAAWYCDNTCQVTFGKKDLNLLPIYMSI